MRRVHPRLSAWHVYVITLVGSVTAGVLATVAGLRARGRIELARRLLWYGVPSSGAIVLLVCALPVVWYHLAWGFLAVNALLGLGLVWWLRRRPLAPEPPSAEPRGTGWSVLWGILGGALMASYIGGGAGVVYFFGVDAAFSTLFPSIEGKLATLMAFLVVSLDLALIGAIVGGVLGARRPHIRIHQVVWAAIGLLVTYYTVRGLTDMLINIPEFQAQNLAKFHWATVLAVHLVCWLVRCLASIFGSLFFADLEEALPAARWRSVGFVCAIALASVVSTMLYTGRLSYDYLLIGQLLEKRGHLMPAQRAYQVGLAQRPDEAVSSYLQFRIGLLYRRLGYDQEARGALGKVTTKYTKSDTLVARAHQFLSAMEHAPHDAARYAIPSIDTSTEFKGAYCVPNSLSLVLKFWGVPISAKAIGQHITVLGSGTSLPDIFWYVQQRGLTHWVLPLASMADVKAFLDQRIPLLFYIPRHVLAVFGYDDALNSLVTYDVAEEDIWLDRPVEELMSDWKGELAAVGVVLPPERFASLPPEQQHELDRLTRAYFHHCMHYPYHWSPEPTDQRRALEHLEAAVAFAPEFFFDAAHIYVRKRWSHRRAWLAAHCDLPGIARQGLAFVKRQFEDDEVLTELSLLLLDLEEDDTLYDFLLQRSHEGTLKDHDELVRLLGLLEYRRGNVDAAITHLTTLEKDAREPMILARAFEATNAWQSALKEYAGILAVERSNDDGLANWGGWFSSRMQELWRSLHQDAKAPPLYVRREALHRVVTLAQQLKDQEQLRTSAGDYLQRYPWDREAQLMLADSIVEALEHGSDLPAETREELARHLTRAVGMLRSLDLDGRLGARLERFEQVLASGRGSPNG